MKKTLFLLSMLLLASPLFADENVAKNKSYTLFPAPNYNGCTGSSDLTDLTDGKHGQAIQLWISPECVGWTNQKKPIKIIIDLTAETAINRVTFHTAGHSSGVKFPSFIDVEVSSDGKNFYHWGSLTALSKNRVPNADSGYQTLTFDAEFPTVKARSVRLRIKSDSQYVFCDEVEIFSSDEPPMEITSLEKAGDDIDFDNLANHRFVENSVRRSMENDLYKLERNLKKIKIDAQQKTELRRRLAQLKTEVKNWKLNHPVKNFKAIYPIDELHQKLFDTQAAMLHLANQDSSFAVWNADPYSALDPFELPPETTADLIRIKMMNHERRPIAVNVTNQSPEPIHLEVNLDGIDGNIYFVEFIDSNNQTTTSTALKALDGTWSIPAGMTSQLFIDLAPKHLEKGLHRAALRIKGKESVEIPLEVEISKTSFPAQTALNVGLWDYLDIGEREKTRHFSKERLLDALEIEKDFLVNVTFADNGIGGINYPGQLTISPDGNFDLDFSQFDRWIQQWPDARHYTVFVNINANTSIANIKRGTPEFTRTVANWAKAWSNHIEESGLTRDRVIFHLLDEVKTPEQYRVTQEWLDAIKSSNPQFTIMCNPLALIPNYQSYLSNADIICPVAEIILKDSPQRRELTAFAGKDKNLWIYRCSAGPFNTDPSYYRNQAWLSFKLGGSGSAFWCYGYSGEYSYLQYLNFGTFYALILDDGEKFNPTKHLFALRDGTQDYEYLTMLQQAIQNSADPDKARAGEKILEQAVNQVAAPLHLGTPTLNGQSPCVISEKNRVKILEALDQIQ